MSRRGPDRVRDRRVGGLASLALRAAYQSPWAARAGAGCWWGPVAGRYPRPVWRQASRLSQSFRVTRQVDRARAGYLGWACRFVQVLPHPPSWADLSSRPESRRYALLRWGRGPCQTVAREWAAACQTAVRQVEPRAHRGPLLRELVLRVWGQGLAWAQAWPVRLARAWVWAWVSWWRAAAILARGPCHQPWALPKSSRQIPRSKSATPVRPARVGFQPSM